MPKNEGTASIETFHIDGSVDYLGIVITLPKKCLAPTGTVTIKFDRDGSIHSAKYTAPGITSTTISSGEEVEDSSIGDLLCQLEERLGSTGDVVPKDN